MMILNTYLLNFATILRERAFASRGGSLRKNWIYPPQRKVVAKKVPAASSTLLSQMVPTQGLWAEEGWFRITVDTWAWLVTSPSYPQGHRVDRGRNKTQPLIKARLACPKSRAPE